MINPYARSFMIASRMDPIAGPRLREVTPTSPGARRRSFFRRVRDIDPTKI